MRNVKLLLLGVAACRPAASARLDKAADDTPAVLTDAERQRMEDSAKAWLAITERQWEEGDSAGLMGTYLPSGPIVSAFDGQPSLRRIQLRRRW
jgi:hypothetical protein